VERLAAGQVLERRVADLERRLERQRELEARVDELEGQAREVVALRARNLALEAQLAELSRGPSAPSRAPPKPVNGAAPLRQIRGIGPAFERALEQAGVVSVEQIAAWTAADIARFAAALRIKAERIVREDWVGRARALSKNPETS
jgi:predicted flap endonuclease-1-like 5' DNA nuclease